MTSMISSTINIQSIIDAIRRLRSSATYQQLFFSQAIPKKVVSVRAAPVSAYFRIVEAWCNIFVPKLKGRIRRI
jgi:hypothetical protein